MFDGTKPDEPEPNWQAECESARQRLDLYRQLLTATNQRFCELQVEFTILDQRIKTLEAELAELRKPAAAPAAAEPAPAAAQVVAAPPADGEDKRRKAAA